MATDVTTVERERRSLVDRAADLARPVLAVVRSGGPIWQVVRFTWHFVQMAVITMLGMAPLGLILAAVGQSDLGARSPAAYALAMTASMVLPMGAFMIIRGQGWERTAEMCGAMSASTVVAAVASLAGLLPPTAALSGPVSTLMWAGMLGAMIVRWPEYAGRHHGHGHATGTEPLAAGQGDVRASSAAGARRRSSSIFKAWGRFVYRRRLAVLVGSAVCRRDRRHPRAGADRAGRDATPRRLQLVGSPPAACAPLVGRTRRARHRGRRPSGMTPAL